SGSGARAGYPGVGMVSVSGASVGRFLDATAPANATAVQNALAVCNTNWAAAAGLNGARGLFWEGGEVGMTLFDTVVTPNSKENGWSACRHTGGGWPDQATFANASSSHSGGVNALFCDGSVKFVKDSINQRTWWSLGTRAGGEVVSADSY